MQNPTPTAGGALQALRSVRLTGSPAQLRNAVARYQASGELAELTAPQPVLGRPGVLTCDVRLYGGGAQPALPAGRVAAPRRRRRRWPYILAAVIVALALLCWAIYALVTAVAAAVAGAGPVLAGVGLLAAVLLLATSGGRKTCTTIVKVTHKH
jgi:hypothetical protein